MVSQRRVRPRVVQVARAGQSGGGARCPCLIRGRMRRIVGGDHGHTCTVLEGTMPQALAGRTAVFGMAALPAREWREGQCAKRQAMADALGFAFFIRRDFGRPGRVYNVLDAFSRLHNRARAIRVHSAICEWSRHFE